MNRNHIHSTDDEEFLSINPSDGNQTASTSCGADPWDQEGPEYPYPSRFLSDRVRCRRALKSKQAKQLALAGPLNLPLSVPRLAYRSCHVNVCRYYPGSRTGFDHLRRNRLRGSVDIEKYASRLAESFHVRLTIWSSRRV